jgi:hypothetical protein
MLQLPQLGVITPQFNTTIRKIDFEAGFADIEVELNPVTAFVRVVRPKTADGVDEWVSNFSISEENRTLRRIQLSVEGDLITLNKIMIKGTWYEVHSTTE